MGAGERARELEEGDEEGERLWTGTYSAGEEGDALTIGIGEDMVVLDSLAVGHGRISGVFIYTAGVARRGQQCAQEDRGRWPTRFGRVPRDREGSLSFRHCRIIDQPS